MQLVAVFSIRTCVKLVATADLFFNYIWRQFALTLISMLLIRKNNTQIVQKYLSMREVPKINLIILTKQNFEREINFCLSVC